MIIRPLSPFDAAEMAELEKRCFPLPWSLDSVRAELGNPIGVYFGAFTEGMMAGYAGMQAIAGEGYITNIAAAPEHRRRGLGSALLKKLIGAGRERGLAFLTLEVRASNTAAQSLYEKHGFSARGRRKNYYDKPKEDAVIMTREYLSL
jgi:ribosomal-protein-alanine N-acetyltransferase